MYSDALVRQTVKSEDFGEITGADRGFGATVVKAGNAGALTPALPDHASPSEERRHMAVSKSTRRIRPRTNTTAEAVLRKSNVSAQRRRAWRASRGGESDLLRFPDYEQLYLLNTYAGRLIDVLKEIGGPLSSHHRAAVELVRSGVSQHVLERLNGVEITDMFLLEEMQRRRGEIIHD